MTKDPRHQDAAPPRPVDAERVGLQARYQEWMAKVCEGDPTDLNERCARAAEEFFELMQALHFPAASLSAVMAYTYARPVGEASAEMGGAVSTLAALAEFVGLDMLACGETELLRVNTPEMIAKVRGKRSRRHGRGVLPGLEADVVPASPTPPVSPTPDSTGPAGALKTVADALAKADGWEDPDALWTDNVGVISRGGKGDPVWTQYSETAALVLAALTPSAPSAATVRDDGARERIAEVVRESGDCWKSCSGCHETIEGHETGHYPYSETFHCHVGAGCVECGGLGVRWEHYTDEQFAEMEAEISPAPASDVPGDAQAHKGWRRDKLDKVIKTTVHAHAQEQLSRDECADLVRGLLADFDDMVAGRHEFADCYAPPAPADRSEGGRNV